MSVSLIDLTSNILSQNTICFEMTNLDREKIPVPIEDAKFGLLNFSANKVQETNNELDFLFTIDCSGSMSNKCSDNRTKMQHITHTLKNMIYFFYERQYIKVNITIHAFDKIIYEILERTKINSENIHDIIAKIDNILPHGFTNIELALEESYTKIEKLKTLYHDNIIIHIFMTDGEATDGSTNISILKGKVDTETNNIFIGFGIEHDSALLSGISSNDKSNYYFIDKLENAGLVYGEILHNIIYKVLDNVEINIENGLIYDFKTNSWQSCLRIGEIVSESNKIFNIISYNHLRCKVTIKGFIDDFGILFPSTLINENNNDLTVHIYRQRTLQLLYEVNDYFIKKRENEYWNLNISNIDEHFIEEENQMLKMKLLQLFEEIKKYMADNNVNDNKILKNLCDDIYICHRTLGTKIGHMFCTARQTSQGTQRQYIACNIDGNYFDRRSINMNNSLLDCQNDYEVTTDFENTPYLSPQATQIMREINCIDTQKII
jgi:hypothetical protein